MNTSSHNQNTEINFSLPVSAEDEILRNRKNADLTQPLLLPEDQNQNENLKQIDQNFDDSHFSFRCWLYALILVSFGGFTHNLCLKLTTIEDLTFEIGARYGYFIFFTLLFLQNIVQKLAMFQKDLKKANFAFPLIILNTFASVLHTLFLGYKTIQCYESYPNSARWIASHYEEMTIFLGFSFVFTATHIFFTLLPAIKVRNDLVYRQAVQDILPKI